jgi:hypothetical protein
LADGDHTALIVFGILGLVALTGLFLFAMRGSGSSGGPLTVLDESGNVLYTVSDSPRRVVGTVPFQPAN